MTSPPRALAARVVLLGTVLAGVLGGVLGGAAPAHAGGGVQPGDPANPTNPLAGRTWGVYKGTAEPSWMPYRNATGETRRMLRTIALAPKAKFFGRWIPDREIGDKVREYVASATKRDPGALVQLTAYRLDPWQSEACRRVPTAAEARSYRRWIDRFAEAIGDANAAVVLQPDGPFARCAPGGSTAYSDLLAGAVRRLDEQPNTNVYIEMGSADWFRGEIADAVRLLLRAGVADARGFALDTSHFDALAKQVRFGSRIVDALADQGAPGKHFVIDTSDNGAPFSGKTYHQDHGDGAVLGHAPACTSVGGEDDDRACVTLGVPPTTRVAAPAWGLTRPVRALAAEHVDGYFWISRPWLFQQSGPFDLDRALQLVRTTPFG